MRDPKLKSEPLLNLRLEPFLPYIKDKPPKRRFFTFYSAAAFLVLTILITGVISLVFIRLGLPLLAALLEYAVIFISLYSYMAFRKRSKRKTFDAKEELLKDPRAPVLYLRPFYADPPELPTIVLPIIRTSSEHLRHLFKASPEEALTKLFRQLGPVITVGRPGEKLPQLGAIRAYFDDEDWQEKVIALMTMSQLVIIQPGYTVNLEWEMALAKALLQHYRLLFSFVCWRTLDKESRQREYEMFRLIFERTYGISLPEQIGNALYLYFDHDWTPHLDYGGGYVNEILTRGLAGRYGLKDVNDVDNTID